MCATHHKVLVLGAAVLAVMMTGCPGPPPGGNQGGGTERGRGDAGTPLLDLLGTLPKDRWPADEKDSLRLAQAVE